MRKKPLFLAFIFLSLFLLIIFFHTRVISRPLIGHHDFINGTYLTVASIWQKEGILSHSFSPVYSFNGDIALWGDWGVAGKNGRMYYVSYPPGSFIIFYLFTKLPFIGIRDNAPRIISLLLFLMSLVMIFRYLYRKYGLKASGVGIAAYSLFPISAYFLGGLYSFDTVILPLWFVCFLLFLKLMKNPHHKYSYFGFFMALILLSFSEWIGILLAVSLMLLIIFWGAKLAWSKRYKILFVVNLLISPLLAIFFSYFLYLQQIAPDNLHKQLISRFLRRSNINIVLLNEAGKGWWPYLSGIIGKLNSNLQSGFGTYFIYLFIIVLAILVISGRYMMKSSKVADLPVYLSFFIITPLLHFITLSSFHIDHDFGNLYFLFIVMFVFVWAYRAVGEILKRYLPRKSELLSIGLLILIIIAIPLSSQNGYKTYFIDWVDKSGVYNVQLYKNMRKLTGSHDLILTNHLMTPKDSFYYQRNAYGLMQGEVIVKYKNPYPKVRNTYYMTDAESIAKDSCGRRPIIYKDLLYFCKLD